MATERGRQLALGAVVVVLAFMIYRLWTTTSAEEAPSSNRGSGTTAARQQQAPTAPAAPGVNLEALNGERPRPKVAERNLFRFRPKPPPPPPPSRTVEPVIPVNPVPTGPPPPPQLPPIALKFIGIIESPTSARKIAVLSDGRNPPFHGVEGDIIEGRYRILKIGVESIEVAYADGRGRQTIRLTGS
jgi:hypothetical protein